MLHIVRKINDFLDVCKICCTFAADFDNYDFKFMISNFKFMILIMISKF